MLDICSYERGDELQVLGIWNEVVRSGIAFPQDEELCEGQAHEFFSSQSYSAVARKKGEILGVYIVHPNNVGRCSHIANASYAVSSKARGQGVGRKLVEDSLVRAKSLGFRIMQFNAVVASNVGARHLYESLGFRQLGTIEKGFYRGDGVYEDIISYWIPL